MGLKASYIYRIVIAAGVSFLIISLMLRLLSTGVDSADRPQFFSVMNATGLGLVFVYLISTLAQAFFRAVRYNLLIAAAKEGHVPRLGHTYLVTVVRNMAVDLLPARLGELSYVAMMNRGYNVSGKTCVSSLAISFIFDLMALLIIISGLLVYRLAAGDHQSWMMTSVFSVIFIAFIAAVGVFWGVGFLTRILHRLPKNLQKTKWVSSCIDFMDKVSTSITTVKDSGMLTRTLFLSLGVRICKYAGLYFLFRGVVIPSFKTFADIDVVHIVSALLGAEGAASLPIPSFMSFGAYESGGLFALMLLGFEKLQAFMTMLVVHVWSQLVDYTVGGIGLILFLFMTVRREQKNNPMNWRRLAVFTAAGLFLIGSLVFFASQYRSVRKLGAFEAPDQGEAVHIPEFQKERLTQMAERFSGNVVWGSNRTGNHEIVMLSFPSLKIETLTNHPHVDFFPRFSPDGKYIIFSRSQQPWVSQRNPDPWDVYLMDITTRKERFVAKNGCTPTWSPDGKKIYFQRNTYQFVEHDLSSGSEKIIHEAGKKGIKRGIELQTPNFNPKINVSAITLRRVTRSTALIFSDGRIQNINGGCQITWGPGFKYLYFVENHAFHRVDLIPFKHEIWLDLSSQFENQYFPKVSNDNKYLVFGGAITGHEHDTADYEIWLWEIGTPKENSVRLTYHSGNDCWPDIFIRDRM